MSLRKLYFVVILTSLFLNTSCNTEDDAGRIIDNTKTTFEIIAESPNHNILEQLIVDSGLKQTLDSDIFTVFAPTDEAFGAIDINGLSDDDITQILLNHVLNGKAESRDFNNDYFTTNAFETFTGEKNFIDIYVNVDGGLTLNGISFVTTADIQASNGVLHIVDAVIPIANVTTFITADNNLSILESALTRDDQPDFVSTLGTFLSPAPFTLFTPSNEAFENLFTELEIESLDDIDTAVLTSVLNSHVIAEDLIRAEDITTGMVSTLGEDFDIDADTNTITDQNNRTINIALTNIQAGNGVLHLIDKVILPSLD